MMRGKEILYRFRSKNKKGPKMDLWEKTNRIITNLGREGDTVINKENFVTLSGD